MNTKQESNEMITVKGVVTVLQGTIAIISTIVIVAFFIASVNNKANTALQNGVKTDKIVEEIQKENKTQDTKMESNQKEILSKLTDIQIKLENKTDRK